MESRYFFGSERRLCRNGDVFRCLDLLVFPKKYSIHLLVVLCIERVGLKLLNYKSHKLMKSFCWVVFMKMLHFVWQSMVVVCWFHDVSIHAFSKKRICGVFLLFFFPTDRLELKFPI